MADNSALITGAVITGIIAVLTLVFKSGKKSECWKTDKGVCCDFDTRTVRSSRSTLDTVVKEHIPKPVIVSTEV